MSRRNKSPMPQISEEEYQRRHVRTMFIASGVFSVARYLIVGIVVVACFFVTFALPVIVSHGETTTITVVQNWLANLDAHVWVSWVVTAGAVGYGLNERKLRRKERSEKDARIVSLERDIDPGRTSSGIDQSGNPQQGTSHD